MCVVCSDMFILVELEDTIRIRAEDFGDVRLALRTEIARNYTHRVLNDVGLVVGVHDILSMDDPYVCMAADGSAQITLQFRLVVFRPALGETIVGKVLASTPDGIQVSLDFTTAVFIPSSSLPTPSKLFVVSLLCITDDFLSMFHLFVCVFSTVHLKKACGIGTIRIMNCGSKLTKKYVSK